MSRWYVVYTHPHAETKAVDNLERQGFATYLPQYRTTRRHARRVEQVLRPLFPRYLFVCVDIAAQSWRPILSTVGVCGLVRNGDEPTPVVTGIVEAIRDSEREGRFDDAAAVRRLAVGDSVRVVVGPFAELVGRFCGLADEERVIVFLDMLGRQVRARLPLSAVAAA